MMDYDINKRLEKQRKAMGLIKDVSNQIHSLLHLDQILPLILRSLEEVMDFKHSMILLVNKQGDKLQFLSGRGYQHIESNMEVGMGEGIIGIAARKGEVIRINNIRSELIYYKAIKAQWKDQNPLKTSKELSLPGLENPQSQIVIPLKVEGGLIGVLSVESSIPNAFDEIDEELLLTVGNQVAHLIETSRKYSISKNQMKYIEDAESSLQEIDQYLQKVSSLSEREDVFPEALSFKSLIHSSLGRVYSARDQLLRAKKSFEDLYHPSARAANTTDDRLPLLDLHEPVDDDPLMEERTESSPALTKRELEIAQLVGKGLSNGEIAQKLYISQRTVTTHIERIYKKLGINSRHSLIRYMIK